MIVFDESDEEPAVFVILEPKASRVGCQIFVEFTQTR